MMAKETIETKKSVTIFCTMLRPMKAIILLVPSEFGIRKVEGGKQNPKRECRMVKIDKRTQLDTSVHFFHFPASAFYLQTFAFLIG
jgi:hypothetical protein